jgi:hypothetical protein
MKVIALRRHTKETKEFTLSDKNKAKNQSMIRQIFATTNYDVIIAKSKGTIFSMELVKDTTTFGGLKVRDPNMIDYTNTKLNYHPLAKKL